MIKVRRVLKSCKGGRGVCGGQKCDDGCLDYFIVGDVRVMLCYVRNVTSIVTRMVFCGSGIGV